MYFEEEPARVSRPKLSPDNDKNHIFYALLAYNEEKKSNNKLRFTYLYSLHQKLLRASLLKEWNLAEHFKKKIELEDHFLGESSFSKTSMLSVRDPAIAFYYYYLIKDYNAALKYMIASLGSIDVLINDGFKDGMFMKIEQFLNTFRVHYNAKNYTDAAYFGKEVLSYLLGNDSEHFQFPIKDVIRSSQQYHEILHLYLNSIFSKSIKNGNDFEVNENFLVVAIGNIQLRADREIDSLLLESLRLIQLFITSDQKIALESLVTTNVFNVNVPVYIQYYFIQILKNYVGVNEKASIDLLAKIGKYEKSILKQGNLGKKIDVNQEEIAA